MYDYDVIITGASFAGLAVANQLHGFRVLLIDRKPVGSGQTSACGTILQVLRYWDLEQTVLRTQDRLVLHTQWGSYPFDSPYPWCTFDYQRLCKTLFERSGAEFLQAAVSHVEGETVYTNRGEFRARCLVDATGWRAALASSIAPNFARGPMNFGVETIRPLPGRDTLRPDALHFWYMPKDVDGGVGWVFPRRETASFGLGSYFGATHLRQPLKTFVERFDERPDGLHGTYFTHTFRAPTAGRVFVVGDAAGMCLGLTGEGIRPAMFFGEACGQTIWRILTGQSTLKAGLGEYAAFANARKPIFQFFSGAQAILTRVPARWIDGIARVIREDPLRPWVLDQYWGLTRAWSDKFYSARRQYA